MITKRKNVKTLEMKITLIYLGTFLLMQCNILHAQVNSNFSNLEDSIICEKFNVRHYFQGDTIFCFYYNKDTSFTNSNIFYVRHNGSWVSKYFDGQISQEGDFKRWKRKMFFTNPFEHFRYLIRGYVIHDNKKYHVKVKVGKWDYYDKNGSLVKSEMYSRDGIVVRNWQFNRFNQ